LRQNRTNRRNRDTAGARAVNYVAGMTKTNIHAEAAWRSIALPLKKKLSFRRLVCLPLCAAMLVLPLTISGASAAGTGDYTSAQSSKGQKVFNQSCSSCHGSNLQGQAGPALVGPAFAKSLQFSKMSASQLYSFISKQMPASDPGSLSKDQYLQVLAYILSKNGYPSGQTPLSKDTLSKVDLLPYPGSGSSSQASK
jgi:mono/diheme cytochrome c family protein